MWSTRDHPPSESRCGRRHRDVIAKRRVRRPTTQVWSFGETLIRRAGPPPHDWRLHPRFISVMLVRFAGEWAGGGTCGDISRGSPSILPMPWSFPNALRTGGSESGETYRQAEKVWVDPQRRRALASVSHADPALAERLRPEQDGPPEIAWNGRRVRSPCSPHPFV